jgi:copper homeostasis protein (lipoprotein)
MLSLHCAGGVVRYATQLSIVALLSGLLACSPSAAPPVDTSRAPSGDNSRNALDWEGVYAGTVPCADCAGIRTRIELGRDGGYSRSLVYLGRDEQPITDSGTFEWDDEGARITLGAGERLQRYQVGENVLFHLDRNGERIAGDLAAAYRLEKIVSDPLVENRRWQLVELGGRAAEPPAGREGAYFELDPAESRITGNASCNRFFGSYELHPGGRIRFGSEMGSTMMACPDLEQEREFLEMLGRVDNYTLGDGMLSLNRARMAPLARFREVTGTR